MSADCLILYGSCARGDQKPGSDVDMLAITNERRYRMIVKNNVNLACYPKKLIFGIARSGELFALHLVKEGVPIFDPMGIFDELKREFNLKSSYQKELSNAVDLGWYLVNFHRNIGNKTLINRRITWCVRTILIAEAASQGKFIFSTDSLVNFSNNARVIDLISVKDSQSFSSKRINEFEAFLRSKAILPEWLSKSNKEDAVREHFLLTKNTVGLKTLTSFKFEDEGFHSYF